MGGGEGMRQNNLSGRSLHSFVEQFSNKGTLVLHCNEGSSTFHSTLMMTSAQVVETSVTTTYNSPSQDYTHPDDQTTPLQVVTLLLFALSFRFCSTLVNWICLSLSLNGKYFVFKINVNARDELIMLLILGLLFRKVLNCWPPKGLHLISPCNVSQESHIKVTRIKEMITN